jgi:hypothetical protein
MHGHYYYMHGTIMAAAFIAFNFFYYMYMAVYMYADERPCIIILLC